MSSPYLPFQDLRPQGLQISTIPGLHIPLFLVDADFLANDASPITLVEVGRKMLL